MDFVSAARFFWCKTISRRTKNPYMSMYFSPEKKTLCTTVQSFAAWLRCLTQNRSLRIDVPYFSMDITQMHLTPSSTSRIVFFACVRVQKRTLMRLHCTSPVCFCRPNKWEYVLCLSPVFDQTFSNFWCGQPDWLSFGQGWSNHEHLHFDGGLCCFLFVPTERSFFSLGVNICLLNHSIEMFILKDIVTSTRLKLVGWKRKSHSTSRTTKSENGSKFRQI